MKYIYFFTVIIGLYSCQNQLNIKDLHYLNGYWEIKEVVFSDGTKKEYAVNTSIDYIELDNQKGFRKKVQPKFNGTYDTSNDAEMFTVYKKEENITLNYKTDLSEWHEKLIQLTEDSFTVLSEENIQYHYKRFEPITIE